MRMKYLPAITQHLALLMDHPSHLLADAPHGLWMSAMRPGTFDYPPETPKAPVGDGAPMQAGCTVKPGNRAYRAIHAPRGSSLYWDQPMIVAAKLASAWTGEARYERAAETYVRAYLENATAKTGMILWGNHYYYDTYQKSAVRFHGDEAPAPVNYDVEKGDLHELRPIPPAWALLYAWEPGRVERCIRAMAEQHLFDAENGGFNRHADQKKGCAFLESGGILIESLCFLYNKVGDASLLALALRVMAYSLSFRHEQTGLIENDPTVTRWDKYVSTTECGLWAGSLLRAAKYSGEERFAKVAGETIDAYLRYGVEPASGRLYGRLFVANGQPDLSEKTTLFQPGAYASAVDPIFPAHDYPFSFLETCVSLYRAHGGAQYAQAVSGWLRHAEEAIMGAKAVYAEQYGRMIHLCVHSARVMGLDTMALATRVADRALAQLCADGLLLGHTGSDAYAAIDGVGYLLTACFALMQGGPVETYGFAF